VAIRIITALKLQLQIWSRSRVIREDC